MLVIVAVDWFVTRLIKAIERLRDPMEGLSESAKGADLEKFCGRMPLLGNFRAFRTWAAVKRANRPLLDLTGRES